MIKGYNIKKLEYHIKDTFRFILSEPNFDYGILFTFFAFECFVNNAKI